MARADPPAVDYPTLLKSLNESLARKTQECSALEAQASEQARTIKAQRNEIALLGAKGQILAAEKISLQQEQAMWVEEKALLLQQAQAARLLEAASDVLEKLARLEGERGAAPAGKRSRAD